MYFLNFITALHTQAAVPVYELPRKSNIQQNLIPAGINLLTISLIKSCHDFSFWLPTLFNQQFKATHTHLTHHIHRVHLHPRGFTGSPHRKKQGQKPNWARTQPVMTHTVKRGFSAGLTSETQSHKIVRQRPCSDGIFPVGRAGRPRIGGLAVQR